MEGGMTEQEQAGTKHCCSYEYSPALVGMQCLQHRIAATTPHPKRTRPHSVISPASNNVLVCTELDTVLHRTLLVLYVSTQSQSGLCESCKRGHTRTFIA